MTAFFFSALIQKEEGDRVEKTDGFSCDETAGKGIFNDGSGTDIILTGDNKASVYGFRNSNGNEQERHLDWTELNEELLSRRSAQEPAPVEDAVYESMQTQALREGVNQLPEVQKRRLQMYFFDGLTYEEIAVREGCSYQAVQKSIAAALKKIRKFLK